ncbi:hypothetical protein JAAARDRAFT_29278 [Jaapia argillacea MUCL 33604]|uniref:Methyltransferase domain-containing protein n=1 Tax=Jaapia argillacea MUCL 33604 TaxID=933084 RepID=A0A067Q8E7_9AGAM|nr:hypothetical protein JAAARDRAFT_29278 [Jaapia argillacea MUCL 33604]
MVAGPSSSPPRRSTTTFSSSITSDSGISMVSNTPPFAFETRRLGRAKENQFTYKYGKRHHSYDPEKAPYPLCYDKEVIELEAIDNSFSASVNKTVTMIDWKDDGPPGKSLDLGCGAGLWIANAAKEWPKCHFVGFDMVNVQLPLSKLDPMIGDRVTFVHGNFLTNRLPFDDDEFDHVHVAGITHGVPENKWHFVFEEINRVLCPGGAVEMAIEDIHFPILPRWFTSPLRHRIGRTLSVHYPDGSRRPPIPSRSPSPTYAASHDHALLELLYYSIFESRFINTRPSAILPSYFTAVFRQVRSAPRINFPMPPLPPLPPLPLQKSTSGFSDPSAWLGPSAPPTRPSSMVFPPSTSTNPSELALNTPSTTAPTSDSTSTDCATTFSPSLSRESSGTSHLSPLSIPMVPTSSGGSNTKRSAVDFVAPEDGTSIGPTSTPCLIHRDSLNAQNGRTLAIHLYRAYKGVLACQESMWEELKDRIRNKSDNLRVLGWEDDEELEGLEFSRQKFERLVDRYRSDMQARLGLWHSLEEMGWIHPPRETLSKAELIEEERRHQAMLQARRFATEDDADTPSRSARVLVGFKLA